MSNPFVTIAAMSAIAFDPTADEVPDWIHVLPAPQDGKIETQDKRGPYFVASQAMVMQRSLDRAPKIPVDENHSILHASGKGQPSPAVGWIVEMQSRQDGLWGRVEWSERGKTLLKERAYLGISPVITHNKAKQIGAITAASLVNTPNLRGLTALHSEELDMSFSKKLAKLFGLNDDATEDEIAEAAQSALTAGGETEAAQATQTALDKIAPVLGLDAGATADEIVEAAQSKVDAADTEVEALQSTVKDLGKKITTLTEDGARAKAEAYFDAQLEQGRVGLNAGNRDRYVSMHMKDPAATEALVGDLPIIAGELPIPAAQSSQAFIDKDPEEIAAQAQELIAKKAALGQTIDIATAVTMIEEGQA